MFRMRYFALTLILFLNLLPNDAKGGDIDKLLEIIQREISGNRTRDDTMRLW